MISQHSVLASDTDEPFHPILIENLLVGELFKESQCNHLDGPLLPSHIRMSVFPAYGFPQIQRVYWIENPKYCVDEFCAAFHYNPKNKQCNFLGFLKPYKKSIINFSGNFEDHYCNTQRFGENICNNPFFFSENNKFGLLQYSFIYLVGVNEGKKSSDIGRLYLRSSTGDFLYLQHDGGNE